MKNKLQTEINGQLVEVSIYKVSLLYLFIEGCINFTVISDQNYHYIRYNCITRDVQRMLYIILYK